MYDLCTPSLPYLENFQIWLGFRYGTYPKCIKLYHILYLNVMVQSTMKFKLRNQHCLRFLLFPAILMFGLCLAWWFLSSQMLYLLSPLLFITLSAGVISPNIIDCKCFFPELCDSEEWVCGLCPQGAPLLVSPFVPSSLCLNSPTTIQSFTSLEGGRVAVDPLPCPWSSLPQIKLDMEENILSCLLPGSLITTGSRLSTGQ